jgi:pyruvate dehydrogenase E2 component (dihydrolipoamide acetyltransferase)
VGEFVMPSLGAGMDVGRVLEWYVQPGDQISRGGIIALVETDKANIEVEVFEAGVVEELLVEKGTKVPVGTPLARIGPATADGAPAPTGGPRETPAAAERVEPEWVEPERGARAGGARAGGAEPVPVAASTAPPPAATEAIDEHPFAISPLVRRQAKEAGVDLTRVQGPAPPVPSPATTSRRPPRRSPGKAPLDGRRGRTDPGDGRGAIVALRPSARRGARPRRRGADRLGPRRRDPRPRRAGWSRADDRGPPAAREPTPASEPSAKPAAADKEERALAMRQAIARAMERSNREIPHYHLAETVDVEATLRWLTERNAELPPAARVLPAAVVLKATALALREFPDLNGYWIDDAFRPGDGIHLGVAINLRRGGLLAPAMRDVDQRSLDEVMEALKDLVQRTRAGGLRGSELTDPTITVSNLGDTGVERIHGVITPPQVALVGVGRITERPWAVDGLLAVRRTLALSLAGDHRASDGHRGGRFLAAIAANLTRPETL